MSQMDPTFSQLSRDKFQVLPHTEYITLEHLTPTNVARNPLDQFRSWFKEAIEGGVEEPEAMSLSTATLSGIPSARIVLLKQVDSRGFVFFTNYTSRKSQEIIANPYAALVFYWRELHRSVRVVGSVERLSREESDAYFRTRPVGSQLGAWASRQSTVVEEKELDERFKMTANRFEGGEVPPPDFWGGWRVIPMYVAAVFTISSFSSFSRNVISKLSREIEFWCGKPSRLHDRVRYLRIDESADDWRIERLSP